ncbi:transposase [Streptomyces sp. NPDC048438]|uniref:transposase n=1 Tax=Streptomyces sp. NPDC048438 TaxID=3365551 RepID=UPI003724915A
MNCPMQSGSSSVLCIVWKFRTDTGRRYVPERYGSWATLHTRFRRSAKDGTFERMLREAQARADAAGEVDWLARFTWSATLSADRSPSFSPAGAPMTAPSSPPRWRRYGCPASVPGRPRVRPDHVLGDKGYGSQAAARAAVGVALTFHRPHGARHTEGHGEFNDPHRRKPGGRGLAWISEGMEPPVFLVSLLFVVCVVAFITWRQR